jgi:hypothetical protein
MPDSDIRRATVGSRREGRRSHAAYGSHARGLRVAASDDRVMRHAHSRGRKRAPAHEEGASSSGAGIALALVYPLMRRAYRGSEGVRPSGAALPRKNGGEGAECMKRKPSIQSLETVSVDEAMAYLDHAGGDELSAAYTLACDRNRLDGSIAAPDEAEVHHAFFLLCRARGKRAPSFDEMRVELRRRAAA